MLGLYTIAIAPKINPRVWAPESPKNNFAGYELKKTVLELGGNDPLIILNDLSDDDLKKAADLAVTGATKNSGQRCNGC